MKLSTLIIGLALLASALPSYAGGIVMMGGGVSSGSSQTFDISENFEGTGTPSGWTISGGSPNPDYSSSGLAMEGTQVLQLVHTGTGSSTATSPSFTAHSTEYATIMLRVSALPATSSAVFYLRSSTTIVSRLEVDATGQFRSTTYSSGGNTPGSWAAAISANSTIYVKAVYTRSGANATSTVYTSSTGAAGTWTQIVTSSRTDADYDIDNIQIYKTSGFAANVSVFVDNVKASTSDINY